MKKTGAVKWFDEKKGFGFITVDGGEKDVFVHHSGIVSGDKFKTIKEGTRVEFEIADSPKGGKAINVVGL